MPANDVGGDIPTPVDILRPSTPVLQPLSNQASTATDGIDDFPATYQWLVNKLLRRGVCISPVTYQVDLLRPWTNDVECPICLDPLTDKIFMEPCGQVCDFECYLLWSQNALLPTFGNIHHRHVWNEAARLVTCPLCRPPIAMSAPDSLYVV